MRARSVVAALALALTSHLWFSQAVAACSTHSREDATAASDESTSSTHHQSHNDAQRHHSDVPANFECCIAFASCGPSVALAPATASATLVPAHLTSQLDVVLLPASRVAAPDPPPPRA